MLTSDPDPSVATWMVALAPRARYIPGERRGHWWREYVTRHYRDARDAWVALRETSAYSQHEDDEFRAEHPPPTFKQFLVGLSTGRIVPEREAA